MWYMLSPYKCLAHKPLIDEVTSFILTREIDIILLLQRVIFSKKKNQ